MILFLVSSIFAIFCLDYCSSWMVTGSWTFSWICHCENWKSRSERDSINSRGANATQL